MANLFLPQIITWFRLDEHVKRLKSILDSLIDRVTVLEETPVPVFTSPYKVYSALLTQLGTDAPVATVLENTLGGEVVWSYVDTGIYTATLANTFTENKTFITSSINGLTNNYPFFQKTDDSDNNTLYFNCFKLIGGDLRLNNTLLFNTEIEIRVYN